jgi:chromosome segregation ATPase
VKEKQKEMLRLEKEKTDMAAKAARQEELEKEVEKLNQEKEKNQELLSEYFKQFGNLNSQIEEYKHRMDTYERQQNDMRRELLDKERQMSMMVSTVHRYSIENISRVQFQVTSKRFYNCIRAELLLTLYNYKC